MIRLLALILLGSIGASAAATEEEKAVLAAVQQVFNGMAAHDAAMIKNGMTADARLVASRPGRPPSATPVSDFANSISSNQNQLLERIWNPTVMIRGNIAMVWADYDFHLNGKFNHCGVDAFLLVKSDEGWKISAISYTSETEGCQPSPLGPPK